MTAPHLLDLLAMRGLLCVFLAVTISVARAECETTEPQTGDRSKVIAALERLLMTGEPRHTSHDEGQWLQLAVDSAVASGDETIAMLAYRAAIPFLAYVSTPVSPSGQSPPIAYEMPRVLTLRTAVAYRAQVWASVDGDELTAVGTFSSAQGGGSLGPSLPPVARNVGLHHVRLRVRITYERSALSSEIRDLPELVYAIYDPLVDARFDSRIYAESARTVSARRLDEALPDVPFANWLEHVVSGRAGHVENAWRIAYCDEFAIESGTRVPTRALCGIAYFSIKGGARGEVWLQTGRIELGETDVRWLADTPTLRGFRMHGLAAVEPAVALSALPTLLDTPAPFWPAGDLSIAPEDIDVTQKPTGVLVSAVIRNSGGAHIRGAYIDISVGSGSNAGIRRGYVADVASGATAQVESFLPFVAPYGVVSVLVMQMSEHSPHDAVNPDPTSDDSVAFRIVNPGQAPRGYAESIRRLCGPPCRGY